MQSTSKDKRNYTTQKSGAKRRGIEFKLTFEEWFEWWQATGHYHERGVGKDKYCMGRYGDTGAYELGNIYLTTFGGNSAFAQAGRRKLSQSDEEQIIALKPTTKRSVLAAMYNVSGETIRVIVNRHKQATQALLPTALV